MKSFQRSYEKLSSDVAALLTVLLILFELLATSVRTLFPQEKILFFVCNLVVFYLCYSLFVCFELLK